MHSPGAEPGDVGIRRVDGGGGDIERLDAPPVACANAVLDDEGRGGREEPLGGQLFFQHPIDLAAHVVGVFALGQAEEHALVHAHALLFSDLEDDVGDAWVLAGALLGPDHGVEEAVRHVVAPETAREIRG
jgi:hypothetical protein